MCVLNHIVSHYSLYSFEILNCVEAWTTNFIFSFKDFYNKSKLKTYYNQNCWLYVFPIATES
jgi:hypothetical protein